jgi:hypothetical protein
MAWPSGAQAVGGMAVSQDGALYVESTGGSGQTFNNLTITGTVTASQVTGIPIVLASWGVPVILASSGTMGNNGAVSAMTALPTTYSGGAWLYLPANAINAGSAAGFYWFVASSTTAGTVYNSTFDGASVPGLGTTTAFVTTGPGAFAGIAAGEFTAATVTVPAGAMGPNGAMSVDALIAFNTAAGNKNPRIRLGGGAGTTYISTTFTTTAFTDIRVGIRNLGVETAQTGGSVNPSMAAAFGAVDTASATTLVFTLEKATATNHVIFHGATVVVAYGA